MIVDTSALVAIAKRELGADRILTALAREAGFLPAPAHVEYLRVAARSPEIDIGKAVAVLDDLLRRSLSILPFTANHARAANVANARYGAGLGVGGTLNLLDLMVYGCAKAERRPILCTGRDFAATDAAIHPASRG